MLKHILLNELWSKAYHLKANDSTCTSTKGSTIIYFKCFRETNWAWDTVRAKCAKCANDKWCRWFEEAAMKWIRCVALGSIHSRTFGSPAWLVRRCGIMSPLLTFTCTCTRSPHLYMYSRTSPCEWWTCSLVRSSCSSRYGCTWSCTGRGQVALVELAGLAFQRVLQREHASVARELVLGAAVVHLQIVDSHDRQVRVLRVDRQQRQVRVRATLLLLAPWPCSFTLFLGSFMAITSKLQAFESFIRFSSYFHHNS